ncbi:hypothetical protein PAAG_11425 [Paracoccidioides lutzii Pb01]|uniref:Uncharacterized protein n=1 Tax=Paracoccidioides lutzii (strain ATCC MYA-826 / Pb01) TaxID=502779 RepID=A0A0A2VLW2_PARBA|nr:hypothetical protein PAAG_11425 [Paracoccidioides lutzii Pb01]KGQ01849.1 hypothetical protein PAAG_11425 [Paracoccidioides lutzii Pb01]
MMRKEPDAEPTKPSDSTGEALEVSQVVLDDKGAVLGIDATSGPEEKQKKPEARRVRKKPQPAVAPVVMKGEENFQWVDIAPKLENQQRMPPAKKSKKIAQPAGAPAVSVNEGVIPGDQCSP